MTGSWRDGTSLTRQSSSPMRCVPAPSCCRMVKFGGRFAFVSARVAGRMGNLGRFLLETIQLQFALRLHCVLYLLLPISIFHPTHLTHSLEGACQQRVGRAG